MYEHILLAVALQRGDMPSPHALAARDAAVALAKAGGAQLSVLTIYSYPAFVPSTLALEEQGRYRQSQIQQTDAQMQAKMEGLFADLCGLDAPITVLCLTGKPGPTIVAAAEQLGVDLIVLDTPSKRHVLDVLLGGTGEACSLQGRPSHADTSPGTPFVTVSRWPAGSLDVASGPAASETGPERQRCSPMLP